MITNFMLQGEDEMDFMPIIPMNEEESDADKDMVYPDVIPVLPLRNTVLFPGVVIPITVGRDKSMSHHHKVGMQRPETRILMSILKMRDKDRCIGICSDNIIV